MVRYLIERNVTHVRRWKTVRTRQPAHTEMRVKLNLSATEPKKCWFTTPSGTQDRISDFLQRITTRFNLKQAQLQLMIDGYEVLQDSLVDDVLRENDVLT